MCVCVCGSRKWREEQAEMLSNKDREETEALEELRNQSKVEIQEWYSRHEEQLTQTKGLNRFVAFPSVVVVEVR